jgi:DNA-binding MarR family transcriptional regulator
MSASTDTAKFAIAADQRRSRLRDFESLREKRAYERRFLPMLKTVVDFDVVCEVGYHQLVGNPLTVKHLLLLRLAPPATVLRRLDRLCELNIVLRVQSHRDGRVHHLLVTPDMLRLFANYSVDDGSE